MADITATDYVQYGEDILLNQFYSAPNIESLLKVFNDDLNSIQDDVFTLSTSYNIKDATGYLLDMLGSIVGEAREGREDAKYRDAIRLRILFNTSSATPNEILSSIGDITEADRTDVWEHYPVSSFYYTDGNYIPDNLATTIGSAVPTSSGEVVVIIDKFKDAFYGSELETNLYNFVDENNNQFVNQIGDDFVVNAGEYFSVVENDRNYLSEVLYEQDDLGFLAEIISETYDSFSYNPEDVALIVNVNDYWYTMNYTVPSNLS